MVAIANQTGASAIDAAANLKEINAKIAQSARNAERDAGAVSLIAVSKRQPIERIEAALLAGHRRFGENYVQAAAAVWPELRDRFDGIELHMIGPLQTNKAEQAVDLFDVIQSLDRPKLARALAKAMEKLGKRPKLLIQINTGEEPQKAGIAPLEADDFIHYCLRDLQLPIEGLMAIPPEWEDISLHTALLCKIANCHNLNVRSIGMSADFETAIRFGSTMVRVGSAIFGPRSLTG